MRYFVSILVLVLVPSITSAQAPRLESVAEFGCVSCPGTAQFDHVEALAVLPNGDVVVVDRANPRIRVFASSGEPKAAFWRSGQGPNEMGTASAVGGLSNGDLLLVDMSRARIARMSSEGVEKSALSLGGFATAASLAAGTGRALIAITGPRDVSLRLVRSSDGSTLSEAGRFGPAEFQQRNGNWEALPFAISHDGSFAVGDGRGAYLIRMFSPEGHPTGEIRRSISRVAKTPDEMSAEEAAAQRSMQQMSGRMGGRAGPGISIDVEPERDYFSSEALRYDDEGRLWVRVERAPFGQTRFDVFGPDRTYLGEVNIEARLRDFAVGNGFLVGVSLDPLDVESIRVWRVLSP